VKPVRFEAVVLLGCLAAVSCKSEPVELQLSQSIQIPEYRLFAADSFGVEFGDSVAMIGSIDDFCYHPSGSVVVLDRAALTIRVFPQNGESYLIGRNGEGPGEFLFPHAVCVLPDGRVLVSDEMKREVLSFDTDGNYLGSYFTTDRYVPYEMFPVDSTSITGSMLNLDMGEEEVVVSFFIGRFDSASQPSAVYFSRQWEWPDPSMYTEIDLFGFVASPDGKVFVAEDNTVYSVTVYSPSTSELQTIECTDVNRIAKTEVEIQEEIDVFEEWAVQDQAYTGGYTPVPYRQLISLTGIDADGNLWIERLDSENEYRFDVWSSAGEKEFTVFFPRADTEMIFSVSQYGILGAVVDPEQFPQVYSLEMEAI
jgi:hypothetical protein